MITLGAIPCGEPLQQRAAHTRTWKYVLDGQRVRADAAWPRGRRNAILLAGKHGQGAVTMYMYARTAQFLASW